MQKELPRVACGTGDHLLSPSGSPSRWQRQAPNSSLWGWGRNTQCHRTWEESQGGMSPWETGWGALSICANTCGQAHHSCACVSARFQRRLHSVSFAYENQRRLYLCWTFPLKLPLPSQQNLPLPALFEASILLPGGRQTCSHTWQPPASKGRLRSACKDSCPRGSR